MLISKYGNGSKELVSEFESRLGIELDEEYKSFLVKYNGGDTPNTHVGIRGLTSCHRIPGSQMLPGSARLS